MFERTISEKILDLSKSYPVVTLTGPRQSGKTTLIKQTFPEHPYVNLEYTDISAAAKADPRQFLERYLETGAIFDEIQQAPNLLHYIQAIVDEQGRKGHFILTGSHQLQLHEAITQSLAGRTALLNLMPLSLEELRAGDIQLSLNKTLLTGFYPRIYHDNLDPTIFYRQYMQTYVERDVRQIIQLKDLTQFQTFIRLCAGRIGQPINYSNLGNELGVSHHTIKQWLSVLEASFIIYRLPPYFSNINKQLVKSPKLYFFDVGLATWLLRIETLEQLELHPSRGHLFENMMVNEICKSRFNQGLDPNLFFFRDNQGHEVDLIYQKGHQLIPIEIKVSATYHPRFSKQLDYFRNLFPNQVDNSYMIYTGEHEQKIQNNTLINYKNISKITQA